MSEKIVKWVAKDGTEFDSRHDADMYDCKKDAAEKMENLLGNSEVAAIVLKNYEAIVAIMTPPKRGRGRPSTKNTNVTVKESVVESDKGEKVEDTKNEPTSRRDSIKAIAEKMKATAE